MAYHSVRTQDVDEYGDEDTLFDARIQPSEKRTYSPQPGRWYNIAVKAFFATATIVIIVLLALNLFTLRATIRRQEILDAQRSNRIADTLPETYGRDRRFMTLDSQYDHLWDEWTADAQIMVPGDLPGEGLLQGAYSMFHQMHCLASFRRAIQTARMGDDPGFDYLDNGHWPHCFDYLRNTILCWADNTIETAAVVRGERQPFIDGTKTVRQCRSPEQMYERMRLDEKAVEKANREDGLDHEQSHLHHHPEQDQVGAHSLNATDDVGQ